MHGIHYCCLLLGISEPELGCALQVEAEGLQLEQRQQLGFEVMSGFSPLCQQLVSVPCMVPCDRAIAPTAVKQLIEPCVLLLLLLTCPLNGWFWTGR